MVVVFGPIVVVTQDQLGVCNALLIGNGTPVGQGCDRIGTTLVWGGVKQVYAMLVPLVDNGDLFFRGT